MNGGAHRRVDAFAPAPSPRYDLRRGTLVRVGPVGSPITRTFVVERRMPAQGSGPSQILLFEEGTHAPLLLTDEAIGFKRRANEWAVTYDPGAPMLAVPPDYGDLTDAEKDYCERCHAYVAACLALKNAFSRSKKALEPTIKAVGEERNERPPCVNTVLALIRRWEALGEVHGTVCYILAANRGNRSRSVVTGKIALAVAYGVQMAKAMPKGTGEDALSQANAWLDKEHPDYPTRLGSSNLRTVQREMGKMNRYETDYLRLGPEAAARKHKNSYERPRPPLPLEEAECDHTTLGILLVDEERQVVFGRPDLIAFRDRCTGVCLGFSIGFEAPSYASFLNGLRHAIYPKDMSAYPNIQNPWFAYGRFKRLYVDNALHFIGLNIRNAGATLGFEVAEFRPSSPWLKGAEERLMGVIDKTVHQLPGATFSDVKERKRYEELAHAPILTLPELRAFLTEHFCDVHNVEQHEGLGFLRTLKGVPRQLWDAKIDEVTIPLPPPESTFTALAGDTKMATLDERGIRWDYIRYQAPDLILLRTHSDHRRGRGEEEGRERSHRGTQYRVTRDPFDLGRVYVTNPYQDGPRIIEATAVRLDYAAGLTLHQHKVNIENARADLKKTSEPEDELMRAKARLTSLVAELLGIRAKQGVKRKLARYLESGKRQHSRSVVTTSTFSEAASADPIDPFDPVELKRPVTASPDSVQPTLAQPPGPDEEAEPIATSADRLPEAVDRGVAPVTAAAARRETADAPLKPDASALRQRKTNSEWDDV